MVLGVHLNARSGSHFNVQVGETYKITAAFFAH